MPMCGSRALAEKTAIKIFENLENNFNYLDLELESLKIFYSIINCPCFLTTIILFWNILQKKTTISI